MFVPEWVFTIGLMIMSAILISIGYMISEKVGNESKYWIGLLFGIVILSIIVGVTDVLNAAQ